MADEIENFLRAFATSLSNDTFVKMTLGNYKGTAEQLQKLSLRIVDTKRGTRIAFQTHFDGGQSVKNFAFDEAVAVVGSHLRSGFRSGHLFTTANDFQLIIGKKQSRLKTARPTFAVRQDHSHNREKHYLIDPRSVYLRALGITTDSGEVRAPRQNKWRQINKFVEVIDGLIKNSRLQQRQNLSIVDMGSGKGYLTFALYDYLANVRSLKVNMAGVDARPDMIRLCSDIADSCGFGGLTFATGSIADYDPGPTDILIALHACDTATDDALFKGISSAAEIIVTAPCCHKEIRKQIKPPAAMKDLLKHGTLLERTAEIVTDGLRAMLLERSGYSAKVFEFVLPEHTPKNNMIAATRRPAVADDSHPDDEIGFVKRFYGIDHQRLESLLA